MAITAWDGATFLIREVLSGLWHCQFLRLISLYRKGTSAIAPGITDSTTRDRLQKSERGEGRAMWNQIYNPLGNAALSTIAAAVPVVTLLVLIASGKVKAHIAAIVAVILTNLIAIFIFTMPAG